MQSKYQVGDETIFLTECPECGNTRMFNKAEAMRMLSTGGAVTAALVALAGLVGLLPAMMLIGFGHRSGVLTQDNLEKHLPIIKRWGEDGFELFNCNSCGNSKLGRY